MLCFVFCNSSFALKQPLISTGLVISEVYGGGGNAGAPYQFDFIELYNNGITAVNLTGFSVQYATQAASSFPTAASTVALPAISLGAGKYFLIQLGNGGLSTPAGITLPTPDIAQTLPGTNMSNANGKVFLVNNTTPVTSCSLASIIDFVGYGTAGCFEGAGAAPTPSNTTSVNRTFPGTDTDNNNVDFTTRAPSPRNSSFVLAAAAVQNFSVKKSGSSTTLDWSISCTSASVRFELQRSSDSRDFNNIYVQTATQQRCGAPFSFSDNQTLKGVNYYRLKITNTEGEISYSKILAIRFSGAEIIKLVPTITSGDITVFYEADLAGSSSWIITDLTGRIITKTNFILIKGQNSITLTTEGLSRGSYSVRGITINSKTETLRFIKQ
jgi:Lamin Tail Domain